MTITIATRLKGTPHQYYTLRVVDSNNVVVAVHSSKKLSYIHKKAKKYRNW